MIAVFGDSVAVGHVDKKGGWVSRLKIHFNNLLIEGKHDSTTSVHNFSISGAHTNHFMDRAFVELTQLEWGDPRTIILALGKNDSAYNLTTKTNEVPLVKYEENLERIIAKCLEYKQTKIQLINVGKFDDEITFPVPWNENVGYKTELTAPYNKVLSRLSEKYNIGLIDVNKVLTLDDLYDGVHLNSKGHEKVFNEVLKALDIDQ